MDENDEFHTKMIEALDTWAGTYGPIVESHVLVSALIYKATDIAFTCAPSIYKAVAAITSDIANAALAYEEAMDNDIEGP